MNRRSTQLRLERLEDRCTPASFGNPWPDAAHLTLSFAPDGTALGAESSRLFSLLNAIAPTSVWQLEILRAFQTWAVNANINLSVVADSGVAFGSAGAPQGDARFGDIRLAALAMPLDAEEAHAAPFQADAGTWSGDVTLNSAVSFGVNGAGQYDLFTVLLHEAGHVLGLDHIADTSSVMYPNYLGPRTGLGAVDVADLQAIYGARTADSFEGPTGNNEISTATALGALVTSASVEADITTNQDRDVYSFSTALNVGGAIIQLRTASVSLLTPRVTIFDGSGHQVAAAASADPTSGGLTIRLENLRPLSTYYVQVSGASSDVFGIGSYQLTVSPLPLLNGILGGVTATVTYGLGEVTNVLLNNDLHTNDSMATALNLPQLLTQPDARFDYGFRGSISDSWDVDYYRLQAPSTPAGTEPVLTAMVWGLRDGGLDPRVRVFDASGNPVDAEILVNDGAAFTVQWRGAVPQATYFVEVLPLNPGGGNAVGNYYLGVDFGSRALTMSDYLAGTLSSAEPVADATLTLTQRKRFHLVLSATAQGSAAGAAVRMTITDSAGHIVFTLTAGTTEAVSANVELRPGTYTVQFTGLPGANQTVPTLTYRLRGNVLSDPIGPQPSDPTADPGGGSSNGSGSPPPQWTGGSASGVPPSDPASNPYGTGSPSGSGSSPSGNGSTSP